MPKITIQGLEFEADAPYKEGDVLNANEADAINQTFLENLRNNFASNVKAAREAIAETNGWFTVGENDKKTYDLDKVTNDQLDFDALQAKFIEYADKYEFGARRAGGTRTPADPVEREAVRVAKEKVKDLLKAKEIKVSEVPKEQMDKLVAQALEKYPEIREQARATVEANKSISLEGLTL